MREDRRRSIRFKLNDITGTITFRADARILNISVAGLEVATSNQMRIGRPCSVTLGEGPDPLKVTGVVVRCCMKGTQRNIKGEIEPIYVAGIKFDGILTHKAQQLIQFIEENARIEVDRRFFGRFLPDQGEPVSVGTASSFQITTISLCGMRATGAINTEPGELSILEIQLGSDEYFMTPARVVNVETRYSRESEREESVVDLEFVDAPHSELEKLREFIAHTVQDGTNPGI